MRAGRSFFIALHLLWVWYLLWCFYSDVVGFNGLFEKLGLSRYSYHYQSYELHWKFYPFHRGDYWWSVYLLKWICLGFIVEEKNFKSCIKFGRITCRPLLISLIFICKFLFCLYFYLYEFWHCNLSLYI